MLWKAPSTSGVISEDREGLQRLRRKCNNWFVAGRTETDLHRRSGPPPCMSQPGMLVRHRWGLGAEAWGLEDRPEDD